MVEAKNTTRAYSRFVNLHCNVWVQQAERWIDLAVWDECSTAVDLQALEGRPCYAGLDLASRIDLTAFVLLFPPDKPGEVWQVVPHFWLPEEGLREKAMRDQVPYLDWVRDGYLHTTDGDITDYAFVRSKIADLGARYQIQAIGFDNWNATQIAQELQDHEGFRMEEVRQGYRTLNAPSKELMCLIMARRIAHGGNPILRWMADSAVVRTDENANIAPNKKKSRSKIDGIVALIMALGQAMSKDEDKFSVYETEPLLVL
ncbi:hypothetical protein LCGC14_1908520 [marine sediment metagenome]|uniref:Terminase large subunit-like endonuclease domain-containing protein n=1 Tax=marine sediment metagenome TaxID=412755 RepID=A0A0F9GHL8_9ZZZZ